MGQVSNSVAAHPRANEVEVTPRGEVRPNIGTEENKIVPCATITKSFETDFRVSAQSQSRKFEFNVFSIIHLNGHNF